MVILQALHFKQRVLWSMYCVVNITGVSICPHVERCTDSNQKIIFAFEFSRHDTFRGSIEICCDPRTTKNTQSLEKDSDHC